VAEPDRPVPAALAALETELRELAHHLELPLPADQVQAVLARLGPSRAPEFGSVESGPPGSAPWWQIALAHRRRVHRTIAAAVLAGLAVLSVSPAGQAAVSKVVSVAGVALRFGAAEAPRRPERLPGETGTTIEAARKQAGFAIVVPAALGDPDDVTVSDSGRVVSLSYRAGPGRPPPGPGAIAARLDEYAGDLDGVFLKQLGVDGTVEYLDLGAGEMAVWIPAPHAVQYVDGAGVPRLDSAHLAARTLIWQVGAVSFRLEGQFSRDQAVAVARGTLRASRS
jgi:hypothetical protein